MSLSVMKAKAVAMMQTVPIPITDARRAALVESLRLAPDERALVEIFFDCITGSPYLPDEQKGLLADLVLREEWDTLATTAGCTVSPERLTRNASEASQFSDFRKMTLLLFRTSRKYQDLPMRQKRFLGGAVLASTSKENLMDVFFKLLPASLTLDDATKLKVANEVLDGRFYRLLLPDCLDCEELSRQHAVDPSAPALDELEEQTEECPICLDALGTNRIQLQCNHSFCTECLNGWLDTYSNDRSCPLCRQEALLPVPPPPQANNNRRSGGVFSIFRRRTTAS